MKEEQKIYIKRACNIFCANKRSQKIISSGESLPARQDRRDAFELRPFACPIA